MKNGNEKRSASVSVIIPAYRAEKTIRRAIDSVLAQSILPTEILVIDDGSPDNQNQIIAEYSDRVTLLRQPNGKTAKARNLGLEHATGDFIAFLDADDYWEPQKLERQLSILETHPEVGLVAGNFFEEKPGQTRTLERAFRMRGIAWDRVIQVDRSAAFRVATWIWTGVTIVRRDVLGGERFVSGLEPAEDRDLWFRLAVRNPIYLSSEALATTVLEPGSISRVSVDRDCSSMLQVVRRHRELLGTPGSLLWRSHTLYRWAALDPNVPQALRRLCLSFMLWPFPYTGFAESYRLGRTKRLIRLLTQSLASRSRNGRGYESFPKKL